MEIGTTTTTTTGTIIMETTTTRTIIMETTIIMRTTTMEATISPLCVVQPTITEKPVSLVAELLRTNQEVVGMLTPTTVIMVDAIIICTTTIMPTIIMLTVGSVLQVYSLYGPYRLQVCVVAPNLFRYMVIFLCFISSYFFKYDNIVKGAFFLFKGLSQRRRLSKSTLALEEASVRSVGLNFALIPCIIIALALLLITFILLEMKILTWCLIVALNIAFLAYWIYTMKRAQSEQNENGYVNSDNVRVNNGNGEATSISTKRTVSSKMIYA